MDFFLTSQKNQTREKQVDIEAPSHSDLPVIVPSRALSDIGRWPLSLTVIEPKQSVLVPVVGLLLALLMLGASEHILDILAVADLRSEKFNFGDFILPSQQLSAIDVLPLAVEMLDHNRQNLRTNLADISPVINTYHYAGSLRQDLRDEIDGAKIKLSGRRSEGEYYLASLAGAANSRWTTLATNLEFGRIDASRRFEGVEERLSLWSHPKVKTIRVVAMSDRSTADVLYQTVWLIEKTRLKTRRLIERGDALLYQPTAIINSGLSRISFNPEAIIKDTSKSVNKKREQILANLAVTAGLIDRVDQAVLAAASYSVASIDLSLTKCRDNLSQLWYEIPRLIIGRLSNLRLGLSEFLTDIRNNWNSFIGGSKDLLLTPTSHSVDSYIGSEAELREQIRRELLTELQGEFDSVFERLRGGEPMILRQPGQGQSGMVVVPAGETIESNDAIKNRLEQMFSDPVSVRFDSDGQSGIITPEFRNRSGGDYIFLLAPILQ